MDAPRRRQPDRPPDLVERRTVERLLSGLPDSGAIPRKEGELSFEAPWQVRALALAVAAHDQGGFPWSDFQRRLVAAISEWEQTPAEERGDWEYYRHWVRALEALMIEAGLADAAEIEAKAVECVKAGEHARAHSKGSGLLAVDRGTH
ncbi:MAG: nitrile hydratase accessory protein [Actinomycetota bacterium]|nr:nitrile hydratase accessory protein [Actinomycetota bacterium]